MAYILNKILFVTSFNYNFRTQKAAAPTRCLIVINTIAAIVYTVFGPIAIQTTYNIMKNLQGIIFFVAIMQTILGYITVWVTITLNICHSAGIASFVNDIDKLLRLAKYNISKHKLTSTFQVFDVWLVLKICVAFAAGFMQIILFSIVVMVDDTYKDAYIPIVYIMYMHCFYAVFSTGLFLVVLTLQRCLVLIENILKKQHSTANGFLNCTHLIEEMENFYVMVHACSKSFSNIFGLQIQFNIANTYLQSIAQIFGFFDNIFCQRALGYIDLLSFFSMFGFLYWFIAICGLLPVFAKRIELTLSQYFVVRVDGCDPWIGRQVNHD